MAGMGLSHAIARGVFAGLFGGRANFVVTLKGGKEAVKKAAGTPWHVVREEVLMLAGLLSAALLTGLWVYFSTVTPLLDRRFESFLWMLMLVLQALPYAAALVCVVLSERPVRRPALTSTLDMS